MKKKKYRLYLKDVKCKKCGFINDESKVRGVYGGSDGFSLWTTITCYCMSCGNAFEFRDSDIDFRSESL